MNPERAHNPMISHHQINQAPPEVIDHRTNQRHQSDRPRNDKAKSANCLHLRSRTNLTACSTDPCNFVITKTMPSLTLAPYRVVCLRWATVHFHRSPLSVTTSNACTRIHIWNRQRQHRDHQKVGPTYFFSCRQNFWRDLHRIANDGQYPHWHILSQDVHRNSGLRKQPGPLRRLVITAQATPRELQLWSLCTEGPPKNWCRPIPTSYCSNHNSNQTRHILPNQWIYSCFHPKVWPHPESGDEWT